MIASCWVVRGSNHNAFNITFEYGDGFVNLGEQCDNANLIDGDGCSDTCTIDAGDACADEPYVCALDCNSNETLDECDIISNGDFNGDGIVDINDNAAFSDCMAGPAHGPLPALPGCADACLNAFNFNGDNDVDLLDFAQFQSIITAQP